MACADLSGIEHGPIDLPQDLLATLGFVRLAAYLAATPASTVPSMEFFIARVVEDPGLIDDGQGFTKMLYPSERPPRLLAPSQESTFAVHRSEKKQLIKGIGFEIMSDSIGSGNLGLPDDTIAVPHDLIPEERTRLFQEMLTGFRYCRLAGGLYWRGLDTTEKHLKPRWPDQLRELREMIVSAGLEGVSFEYWSPAPYWKANRKYVGNYDLENRLRCFGKDFANDSDYHGDVDRFLRDFADACCQDLQTLREAGIPVVMWNMQEEPFADSTFPLCAYTPKNYVRAFETVAPTIRAYDPKIMIIADTSLSWKFRYIRPVLGDPKYSRLVDALAIHLVGVDSKFIRPPAEPSGKPRFNNEFESLASHRMKTSERKCLAVKPSRGC